MIDISKAEMEYLTKVKNVPFGMNGISHCVGSYRKYYLCESSKNMKLINEYRNQKAR